MLFRSGVLGTLSVLAFLIVYVITANIWNPDLPFWERLLNFWNTNAARRLQGTDPDEIATIVSPLKVVVLYFWENLSGKAMLLTTVCGGGDTFLPAVSIWGAGCSAMGTLFLITAWYAFMVHFGKAAFVYSSAFKLCDLVFGRGANTGVDCSRCNLVPSGCFSRKGLNSKGYCA